MGIVVDIDRKKLEEILAALPLALLGKQSTKYQAELARRLEALSKKKAA